MVYSYNATLFTIKILILPVALMKLENIRLSEINETQKPHIEWFHIYEIANIKSPETESRSVIARVSFWGDKMFWN